MAKKNFLWLLLVISILITSCSSKEDEEIDSINKIEFKEAEIKLNIYSTYQLKLSYFPATLTEPVYNFSSNNTNICSVTDNGIINGISAGEAIITASIVDNPSITATCKVTVENIMPSEIIINEKEASLRINNTIHLSYSIKPNNATIKNIKWSSSNESIVTVNDNGLVTAKSIGETYVKVEELNTNISDSCKVIVQPINVTGIDLQLENGSFGNSIITKILINSKTIITPIIYPNDASNKEVLFTSNDENISSVENIEGQYYIKANKIGSTTITATTTDGNYKAECAVSVCDIDEMCTISMSTALVFDQYGQHTYLTLSFSSPVKVTITELRLYDSTGYEPFDFKGFPTEDYGIYMNNIPINYTNIWGWMAVVKFVWNNKEYTVTKINS